MNAVIVLHQPGSVTYTNLDEISGKAIVRCTKSVDVDTIVVKLEGESRTRLLSPGGANNERPKPQLEYHKVSLFTSAHSIECSHFYFDKISSNERRSSTKHRLCFHKPT